MRKHWIVALGVLWPCLAFGQPNLVQNAGFEDAGGLSSGWTALWTRDKDVGSATLDASVKHSGGHALKVSHRGDKDWSVQQAQKVAVSPQDIFAVSGWVKCEGVEGAVSLSVTTEDAQGKVIAWMHGRQDTRGTHGWQEFKGRFIVPQNCAAMRFRVTGSGPGTAWFEDLSLVKEGNVAQMQKQAGLERTLAFESPTLAVSLDVASALLSVRDKRNGKAWQQVALGEGLLVRKGAKLEGATGVRLELLDVQSGLSVDATLAASPSAPELTVELKGQGKLPSPLKFPQPIAPEPGAFLAIPLNEGILYPVDDQSVKPLRLVGYGGHGICMAWFGLTDAQFKSGVMAIVETPDDMSIQMLRDKEGRLTVQPIWEASRGEFAYPRRIRYVFFTDGGYVAQAKRYREYAKSVGLFKTLRQKLAENPNVGLLMAAVNVWNWEPKKAELCEELKSLGVKKALW